jgi:hypothetical protein
LDRSRPNRALRSRAQSEKDIDYVDAYYRDLIAKGLKPSSEPRNREFVICDPDGYKLVFFNKSGHR